MEKYFGDYNSYYSEYMYGYNQNLICAPTQYASNEGAYAYSISDYVYNNYGYKKVGYTADVIGRQGCYWWLRSPGITSEYVCDVGSDGYAGADRYNYVNRYQAVRPAMYIEY